MAGPHKLLVVDDEPDVVQSIKDLFRRACRVIGTTQPNEALRLLHEEPVDIIMSDQRMPEMSGVELLSQARREQPDAVRLLFTGYADVKAVIGAINEGHVYRYIAKPWDPDELQAIVRQAGEQHDLLVERKRLLGELQTANAELQKANAELRQADALKDAFLLVASHELRTPLTVLLGLSDLARHVPGLGPPVSIWFERIHDASKRLHRLVEQMLRLLQAGRFERPLERQSIDLAALVNEAIADVRPFAEQRQQQLVIDLGPEPGTVSVEPGKVRDSLDHLLLNAIKFTPDGGRIEVVVRRAPGGEVEIQVRDNGVGIDAASLARVFDPFFTEFDVSRHSSGLFEFNRRGLGLGLSLVKEFIEMHGGSVSAQSTPGQGSTFTIKLPPSPSPDGEPQTPGEGP